MWCRHCERVTQTDACELCGEKTETDIPVEIYRCSCCNVPIISRVDDSII